jgi:hypothetical protein
MSSTKPTSKALREARDEFRDLLAAGAREGEWQSLFTRHPYVLSNSLPVRISIADIVPLGRPGQSEADFVFYPKDTLQPGSYGVIELKRPDSRILRVPRKEVITLSRDAATALAQAQSYASELGTVLRQSRSSHLFVGNPAQLVLIMGASSELKSMLIEDAHRSSIDRLFPENCHVMPYDMLLELFERSVPPKILHLTSGASTGRRHRLSVEEQVSHQGLRPLDPQRHSIQLDVPPGVYPRTIQLFAILIKDTGLDASDFEPAWERPLFGAMEWLVLSNTASISRFRKAQPILEERIRSYYASGAIRGGSWG